MKTNSQKLVLFFFFLLSVIGWSQTKAGSPAESVSGNINGATITIKYGSPSVKGRAIWGALVPFEQVWRAGANDATTFVTDKTISIEGKQLPAGSYSFFIIPSEKQSIIIFNKVAKQWGSYDYKAASDQLRVTVDNQKSDKLIEKLEYRILKTRIELAWENWIIGFEVK